MFLLLIYSFHAKELNFGKNAPPQPRIYLVNEDLSFFFEIDVIITLQRHYNVYIRTGNYKFQHDNGTFSPITGLAGIIGSESTAAYTFQGGYYNIHYRYGNYSFVPVSERMLNTFYNSYNLFYDGINYVGTNLDLTFSNNNFNYIACDFVYFNNNTFLVSSNNTFPTGIAQLNYFEVIPTPNGFYNVTLTPDNFYSFINLNLQRKDFDKTKSLTFTPSPTTDKINFNQKIKSVAILTLDGKTIETKLDDKSVDVSHLSKGVYVLQIIDENDLMTSQKLIKD